MFPNLVLRRKLNDDNFVNLGGILGNVYDVVGNKICVSLELPDLKNQTGISCIPCGKYRCLRDKTGRHQYYKIADVENRSNIEIHAGNKPSDLNGCIAFGKKWACLNRLAYIQSSKVVLDKMLIDYPDGFDLTIINDFY